MLSLLQQASQALVRNDAETLERLCVQLGQAPGFPTPADLAEYAAQLTVLRRQVVAARTHIVLRQRLLTQHVEVPWVP